MSFRDAAKVFEHVSGRNIVVQSVGVGQPLPNFPDAMVQFIGGFDSYDSPIDMDKLSRDFGIKLTSLEEFAKGFVANAKRGNAEVH